MLIVNVHMPRDRITQQHQSYGFVEFMGEDDADYAIKIMNMIKVYGKPIRVNKVSPLPTVASVVVVETCAYRQLQIQKTLTWEQMFSSAIWILK